MATSVLSSARARRLAGTLGVTAALGLGGAPVLATTQDREFFSGTDSFSYSDCGFPVDVETSFHGHALVRVLKNGQAFLGHTNIWFEDVHTNRQTGRSFVLRGHSLFKEISGTHVEGDIYEFEAIEAGQPFVVEDSDGNVVVRDRGVIRFRSLFDTLGDGMPGGELVADLDAVVHGPHEGFSEDFDFCGMVEELTGA